MPISFPNISDQIRLPLYWAEIDGSLAGTFDNYRRALVVGYKTSSGTQDADVPFRFTSPDQARAAGGAGSQFWAMGDAWLKNNKFNEVWGAVIAEPSAGTAATGSIEITADATGSGVLYVYIAGRRIAVTVTAGDAKADIAAALNTAINAKTDLPVTSTVSTATVTLTAKFKGVDGNAIDIRLNYRGTLGGEALPAGVAVTITAMASGAGVPDLSTLIANLGDQEFDVVVMPWTDTATFDDIDAEWAHDGDSGRWSWLRQIFGHVFTAADGTVAGLQTLGAARNGAHVLCFGYYKSPTPLWERAAMYGARAHRSLMNDPARPLHTLELIGMLPAAPEYRFTDAEQNSLAYDGISVAEETDDGKVVIKTSFSMYQKNAYGQDDNAFLKVQTLFTLAYFLRSQRYAIQQKFPRHKLGNDGTNYGPGQAIVTANVAKAELISHYRRLEYRGLVENTPAYKANLIVERDQANPNRLNVSCGPDLINQLDVFAVLAQFRLQYPTDLPESALQVAI